MKVKLFNSMVIAVLFVLICTNNSWGGAALDEKFDSDLSKWIVLDEPNHPELGQVVNVKLTTGEDSLQVDCNNNDRFRYQGVQSKERYTLPSGGSLVVDFYGTNTNNNTADSWLNPGSHHSHPFWAVASYDSTELGWFSTGEPWDPNTISWFAVKGWDAYWGDWAQWNGIPGGYVNIEAPNPAVPPVPATISLTTQVFKHVIMVIDVNNINVYIEDDYYENLSSPTALYTVATSEVFTTAELTDGLYVYVLAARYTSWYTSIVGERFDGVKVTRVGATVPMNCYEAMDMGYVTNINADINKDCRYDFYDFALIAQDWMECMDPAITDCSKPWLQ